MKVQDHKLISRFSGFSLFCAFVLLLLVALSSPVIQPIYLLNVHTNETTTRPVSELRFGVWGACALSAENLKTVCLGPQLGYTAPRELLQLLQYPPEIADSIKRNLTITLILHPISTVLAFLTMLFSLRLATHGWATFVLVVAAVAGITSIVALAVDIALVVSVRNHASFTRGQQGNALQVDFGNAVWMTLAAVGLVWTSVILVAARVCYCCGIGQHDDFGHNPTSHRHYRYSSVY
ncbi:SUR7/PalI family-domain-containing protein [Coprinopsis sp. MPI-PUGE-AT-0042]|nr:SUR7/PalI family-domain-containing protein [Coprinopsis sp. MPI-PUGE-AT-0042]